MPSSRTPSSSDRALSSSALLSESRIWGEIPDGFAKIVEPQGARLVVRNDQVGFIALSTCRQTADASSGATPFYGRRALTAIRMKSGGSMLVRPYQHGGMLRALTRDIFVTWPPRPFRELTITEELRRRGVPTVEVYAACIEPLGGPMYRGWLVTRLLEQAEDLWAALQSGLFQALGADRVLGAVAKSLRALHREGVYHSDLNLRNILIRKEGEGASSYIIDFDKARLFVGSLRPELAKRNLRRLLRSIRKLDPARAYFSPPMWDRFVTFYDERD